MRLYKFALSAAVAFAITATNAAPLTHKARAAEQADVKTSDKDALTIEQVLNITGVLRSLTKFDTLDKDGKPATGYYKFSADVLFLIADDIDLGAKAEARLQSWRNALIGQITGGGSRIGCAADDAPPPARGAPALPCTPENQKLQDQFNNEWANQLQKPSGVGFWHIKREDLCLEAAPPKCSVANPIPVEKLGVIAPILDR